MAQHYGERDFVTGYDGERYKPVWKTFGGTAHSSFGTNVSNQTLFGNKSTYDGKVRPYEASSSMASVIDNNAWDRWGNKKNTIWYKRCRAWNTNGTAYTSDSSIHSDIYLKFTGDATYQKCIDALSGGYTDIGGQVYMWFYLGTAQTYYDWGNTKYAYSSSATSIGFANNTDSGVPSGQSVMGNSQSIHSTAGWEARHVISYVHNTTGRDVTRCQFKCWGDISGVAQEITWFCRDSGE